MVQQRLGTHCNNTLGVAICVALCQYRLTEPDSTGMYIHDCNNTTRTSVCVKLLLQALECITQLITKTLYITFRHLQKYNNSSVHLSRYSRYCLNKQ